MSPLGRCFFLFVSDPCAHSLHSLSTLQIRQVLSDPSTRKSPSHTSRLYLYTEDVWSRPREETPPSSLSTLRVLACSRYRCVDAARAMARERTAWARVGNTEYARLRVEIYEELRARPAFRAQGCPVPASSPRRTSACRRASSVSGAEGARGLRCVRRQAHLQRL